MMQVEQYLWITLHTNSILAEAFYFPNIDQQQQWYPNKRIGYEHLGMLMAKMSHRGYYMPWLNPTYVPAVCVYSEESS